MQTLSDRLMTVAVTGAVQDADPHVIADAQAEIERLGKEVLGLQIALDACVDGGTFDMVRDALRGLVDALAANDEDGLTEFAEPMTKARAALATTKT